MVYNDYRKINKAHKKEERGTKMNNGNWTYEQEKIYFAVRKELDEVAPNSEYTNSVIATAFAIGKSSKLTENWLRNHLLEDIEDDFITYEEALKLNEIYTKKIESLKCSWGR